MSGETPPNISTRSGLGRSSLLALFLAALLPVLVFVVIQAVVVANEARADAERTAMAQARDIMSRVDAVLAGDARAIEAVSQSVSGGPIPRGAPNPAQARMNAALFPSWAGALVWDRQTGEVVYSSLPEDLASAPEDWLAIGDGPANGRVGNIVKLGDSHLVPIHQSIGGENRGLMLTLAVRPDVMQEILVSVVNGPSTAALVDRRGMFVARNRDIEARRGTPATQYVRAAVERGGEGMYRGRTYEGLENYTAYVTSQTTGWSTHVAVPSARLDTPGDLSFLIALVGGLACVGVTAALILLVLGDARRRRKAEEALVEAQKLEALGMLTGGLAHDFNNILTVIIGNLEKVRGDAGAKADASGPVDIALASARRAAGLTRSLLAFARQQPLHPQRIELGAFVRQMTDVARSALGERYAVEADLQAGEHAVAIDESQLTSAILNLAINARDAMPDGGRITLELRDLTRDEAMAAGLSPGDHVRVTVTDNGPGMPPEIAEQAFQPFFTTKDVGRGTGLGLAQVYGFMKQSGGVARIRTSVGGGTSVDLCMPRLAGETGGLAAVESVAAAAPGVRTQPLARAQRVLVVEDEPHILQLAEQALSGWGCEVRTAHDAETARAWLGAEPFDVLFTDIRLPGSGSGADIAREALAANPGMRIVFATGFAGGDRAAADALGPVIDKPYSMDALRAHVLGGDETPVAEKDTGKSQARLVLVVEDEALIRQLVVEDAQDAGYGCVEAVSVAEALVRFDERGEEIGCVVADLGLPDGSGVTLVQALRKQRPSLPVILTSGRVLSPDEAQAVGQAVTLTKPYPPEAFTTALHAAMRG